MAYNEFDRISFKGILDLLGPNLPAQFKLVSYYSNSFGAKQTNTELDSASANNMNYVNDLEKLNDSHDAVKT
jgi:hypothetical protein